VNVFTVFGADLDDFERVFLFRGDRHFSFDLVSGSPPQFHPIGFYSDKFINNAANGQLQAWIFFIVCKQGRMFADGMATFVKSVDFQGNVALATGRDLPRVGGRRAPSVGLDALNFQRGRALVLNDKGMRHLLAFNHRIELIDGSRQNRQRLF